VNTEKDIEPLTGAEDERLTILFWNGFWNWPFFGMGVGNRGFISNKCKYRNCYTTNNRTKLRKSTTRIDAIVVHGWDADLAKLAKTNVSLIILNFLIYIYFLKDAQNGVTACLIIY
jgi:hypothetical protein